MDQGVGGGRTRRELVCGALGAGAAALAAGLGASAFAQADAATVNDGTLLTAALQAEQVSVLAYRRVLLLPDLSTPVLDVLPGLLAHERAHVRSLERDLVSLGYALPAPPRSYAQADEALGQHGMHGDLATVHTVKDALQYLLDVEALCEGAYYTAVAALAAPGPLVRAAQALASDAQHSTLLNNLLNHNDITVSVPTWYVAGVT